MFTADDFVRFVCLVKFGERHECWEWAGNCPGGRHGHFSVGTGKTVKAHRWVYELLHGPIHKSLVIRHKCDNPKCVNPLHLEIGTSADNTRDAIERGRWPDRSGEKHPLARLDTDAVLSIRRAAAVGVTHKRIAAQFGVSRSQIGKIVNRINWDHV